MSYFELLKLAMPETIMVFGGLCVVAADLLAMRELELRIRRSIGALIASVGCLVALGWMVAFPEQANFMHGMLVVDPLTQLLKCGLVILTLFTIWLSVHTEFTEHVGEYFTLIMLATVGMMFLVSAEDILMIFVSLELTSLSLYVLTAFNKRNLKSAEAALKYFLFGGTAAAFTLFGLSLIYGLSGATNLGDIATALKPQLTDPLLMLALVMTIIGFGFKIAAVPFHLWAPDAYEGAPTPSAALIASGSKVASFFVLAKVMILGFAGAEGNGGWRAFASGWVPVLALIGALSMVLGNLGAIAQTNVRRLLAYSAIAHGGYMLLGVIAYHGQGLASLVYYAVTYGLTTVGAFGVVAVVENQFGGNGLSDFAGLGRRAPIVSFCMLIFMLSLAGIPPLAGFFGKFYVFAAAVNGGPQGLGLLWLVILAIGMSAVSLYYYLQVLKQIYVIEPAKDLPEQTVPIFTQAVLGILAFAVLVLGAAPNLLLQRLLVAIKSAGLPG
jgi:NADH-quinone oxidoreductase subunit N